MTPLFRIAWSVPTTGFTGHGAYCLSYEEGKSYLHSLNKNTNMEHWMEKEGKGARGRRLKEAAAKGGGEKRKEAAEYFNLNFKL
jgi:hypothetical protein